MGGRAKGLLSAPDGLPIIERTLAAARRAFGRAPIFLVGEHPAYAHLKEQRLTDDPAGIGPLGGLRALLLRAGAGAVVTLACDMPFLSAHVLRRLGTEAPDAPALAARLEGRWQPLCARYRADAALPVTDELIATGKHGLFQILDRLDTSELVLSDAEAKSLRDWDSPADMS